VAHKDMQTVPVKVSSACNAFITRFDSQLIFLNFKAGLSD